MARYSRNDQAGIELPKGKLDRESLRQALGLFRYLHPYRGRFSAALVALFASSLLSLSFPYLAGSMIDAALPNAKELTDGSAALPSQTPKSGPRSYGHRSIPHPSNGAGRHPHVPGHQPLLQPENQIPHEFARARVAPAVPIPGTTTAASAASRCRRGNNSRGSPPAQLPSHEVAVRIRRCTVPRTAISHRTAAPNPEAVRRHRP